MKGGGGYKILRRKSTGCDKKEKSALKEKNRVDSRELLWYYLLVVRGD